MNHCKNVQSISFNYKDLKLPSLMATVNKKNEGKKMTNNSLKNEDFILLGQTDSV